MTQARTRKLSVPEIVFMVIAAVAPIAVVAANFPIIFGVSGSVGAPLMVLVATAILLLFSVGYAWMTPHVPDAGAFYSYVDRGLGRRLGLGTASIALLSYVLLTVSMTCYPGVQAGNLFELWTGMQVPWWLISGLLFAFLGFFGFEATAVFRNEARDPECTVPRATYIAVIAVGALYFVSSWLVIAGLGADDAVALSNEDPAGVVVGLAGDVVAPIMADIVQVLVVTSMFACMLAFHNIVTRYLFTLGERDVLPRTLATVHPKHSAPSRASLWVTIITAAVVVVSALAQLDPVLQIYTWYSGAGAVGVIVMMTLASFAVVAFRARLKREAAEGTASSWVTVASLSGGIGLVLVLAIAIWNFPFLVGGIVAAIIWGAVLAGFFAIGMLLPSRS